MQNKNQEFIIPTRNDQFSMFRGLDLQQLLVEVENFFLIYRMTLNIPAEVSFGVEIEYERVLKSQIEKYIKNNLNDWTLKKDGSLSPGGEINSPILYDNTRSWNQLREICNVLKKRHANTSYNAAGHIHIGAHILNNAEDWKAFLLMYTRYEPILVRFLYGDKINARYKMQKYAPLMADYFYKNLSIILNFSTLDDVKKFLRKEYAYHSINFNYVDWEFLQTEKKEIKFKNTIEFRSPNATIEETIWQNNINALVKLLLASKKHEVDLEYLKYTLEHERISSEKEFALYDVVNLKDALEFVDIVFDNNLDKVYFLRQYIKNFQENRGSRIAVKAKRFVR